MHSAFRKLVGLASAVEQELLGLCACRVWTCAFAFVLSSSNLLALALPSSGGVHILELGKIVFFAAAALAAFVIGCLDSRVTKGIYENTVAATVLFGEAGVACLVAANCMDSVVLAALAGVLGGITIAVLRIGWGYIYSLLDSRTIGVYISVSFLCATPLCVMARCMTGAGTVILLAIVPLFVAFCLARLSTHRPDAPVEHAGVPEAEEGERRAFSRMPFVTLLLGMGCCVFASSLIQQIYVPPDDAAWFVRYRSCIADGLVSAAVLALFCTKRNIDSYLMFVVILPIMMLGYVLSPIVPAEMQFIGTMVVAIGYGLFELISWIVLMDFAHYKWAESLRIVCLGVASLSLGRVLGVLAGTGLCMLLARGSIDYSTISLVMVLVLSVLCGAIILPRISRFPYRQDPLQGAHPLDEGAPDAASSETAIETLALRAGFTARETDVFRLLADGANAQHIADDLCITVGTAKTHIKHVYAKLGIHSQQELIDIVGTTAWQDGPQQ